MLLPLLRPTVSCPTEGPDKGFPISPHHALVLQPIRLVPTVKLGGQAQGMARPPGKCWDQHTAPRSRGEPAHTGPCLLWRQRGEAPRPQPGARTRVSHSTCRHGGQRPGRKLWVFRCSLPDTGTHQHLKRYLGEHNSKSVNIRRDTLFFINLRKIIPKPNKG